MVRIKIESLGKGFYIVAPHWLNQHERGEFQKILDALSWKTHERCPCGKPVRHGRHRRMGQLMWFCECGDFFAERISLERHLQYSEASAIFAPSQYNPIQGCKGDL